MKMGTEKMRECRLCLFKMNTYITLVEKRARLFKQVEKLSPWSIGFVVAQGCNLEADPVVAMTSSFWIGSVLHKDWPEMVCGFLPWKSRHKTLA